MDFINPYPQLYQGQMGHWLCLGEVEVEAFGTFGTMEVDPIGR